MKQFLFCQCDAARADIGTDYPGWIAVDYTCEGVLHQDLDTARGSARLYWLCRCRCSI